MKVKQKNNSGFAALVVILLLVALIAAVTVGTYFVMTKQNQTVPAGDTIMMNDSDKMTEDDSDLLNPPPISESLELEDIEQELNDTLVGTPENDLQNLESESSGM